jgi:hypothetical protein
MVTMKLVGLWGVTSSTFQSDKLPLSSGFVSTKCSKLLINTAWRFQLGTKGLLKIYWKCSHWHLTMDKPSAWGLGRELKTHLKKQSRLCNVTQDLRLASVLWVAIQCHSLQVFQNKVQKAYGGEFESNMTNKKFTLQTSRSITCTLYQTLLHAIFKSWYCIKFLVKVSQPSLVQCLCQA